MAKTCTSCYYSKTNFGIDQPCIGCRLDAEKPNWISKKKVKNICLKKSNSFSIKKR